MKNEYFESISDKIDQFNDLLNLYDEKVVEFADRYGYESFELNSLYREKYYALDGKSPTIGEYIAFFAWRDSNDCACPELAVDSRFPTEDSVKDFLLTLKRAGITEFVLIDTSKSLMDSIHMLMERGCIFIEPCVVHYNDEERSGLRFRVSE